LNFFEHQDLARRNTRVMMMLYALAVVAVVVAVAEPRTPQRAKALLWSASRLAAFGESVGLEPSPEPLLREAMVERFWQST
jgi:hypothetical protein